MAPTVLHLLGQWKDAQIVFPVPVRPDLWRRAGEHPENQPYIVVQQLEICKNADHRHFPLAETALFPGAENALIFDDRQEAENYNWQPWERQQQLVNWNLTEANLEVEREVEDVGFVETEEEEEHFRYRRQAPPVAPAALTDGQVQVGVLLRGGGKKVEIAKVYSAFLNAFVVNLSSKIVPVVRESFQDVWKEDSTWKVELVSVPAASTSTAEPKFKVKFTVPAFASLQISDVSVWQALGFDSIGQKWQTDPTTVRTKLAADQSIVYYWMNNSNKARVYESKRAVPNMAIYKLRALAQQIRKTLPAPLLEKSPEIENVTQEIEVKFSLTFDYLRSSNVDPIVSNLQLRLLKTTDSKLKAYAAFFQQLVDRLTTKLNWDSNLFKVLVDPASNNTSVSLNFQRNLLMNLDRFAIIFKFGPNVWKDFEFLDEPALEWNLGRQNPKLLQVLPTAAQIEAAKVMAVQEMAPVEEFDPEAGLEGAAEQQRPTVEIFDPEAGAGAGIGEAEQSLLDITEEEPTGSGPAEAPANVQVVDIAEEATAEENIPDIEQEETTAEPEQKLQPIVEETLSAEDLERLRKEGAAKRRAEGAAAAEKKQKEVEETQRLADLAKAAKAETKRLQQLEADKLAIAQAAKELDDRIKAAAVTQAEIDRLMRISVDRGEFDRLTIERERYLREQNRLIHERAELNVLAATAGMDLQPVPVFQQPAAPPVFQLPQPAQPPPAIQQPAQAPIGGGGVGQQQPAQAPIGGGQFQPAQPPVQQQQPAQAPVGGGQQQQPAQAPVGGGVGQQHPAQAPVGQQQPAQPPVQQQQPAQAPVGGGGGQQQPAQAPVGGGGGQQQPAQGPIGEQPAGAAGEEIVQIIIVNPPGEESEESEGEEGGGEGGIGGAGDVPIPDDDPPAENVPQNLFRRDRLRYLVGNARRKRRMPAQNDLDVALPGDLILIMENSDSQNDFVSEWGRCCIAANIQGGKVTSRIKCFIDLRNQEELIFNLLDSQHLCLMRSPETSLAKIEIHAYL